MSGIEVNDSLEACDKLHQIALPGGAGLAKHMVQMGFYGAL